MAYKRERMFTKVEAARTLRLSRHALQRLRFKGNGSEFVLAGGHGRVAIACPELRVLYAVSLGNMANLELPGVISQVFICGDHDEVDDSSGSRQRRNALARTIHHYRKPGRDLRLAMPEIVGADWNDILQGVER